MKKIIDSVTYDTDKDEFLFGCRRMLLTSYYFKTGNEQCYEYNIIGLTIKIFPITKEELAWKLSEPDQMWLSKPSELELKYGV